MATPLLSTDTLPYFVFCLRCTRFYLKVRLNHLLKQDLKENMDCPEFSAYL